MKEVHNHPCKYCPSEWYPQDPEAEDLLNACVSGKITEEELLFPCAWRTNKICRGLWNRLMEKKGMKTYADQDELEAPLK